MDDHIIKIKEGLEKNMSDDLINIILEYAINIEISNIAKGYIADSIVIDDKIAYIDYVDYRTSIIIIDPKNNRKKKLFSSNGPRGTLFSFSNNIIVRINPIRFYDYAKTTIDFYFLDKNTDQRPDFTITKMIGYVSTVIKLSDTEYCFDGQNIEIWDIQEGKLKYTLPGNKYGKSMLLLPNNQLAVNTDNISFSDNENLRIWDLETKTSRDIDIPRSSHGYKLSLLKNNKILAIDIDNKYGIIVDYDTGQITTGLGLDMESYIIDNNNIICQTYILNDESIYKKKLVIFNIDNMKIISTSKIFYESFNPIYLMTLLTNGRIMSISNDENDEYLYLQFWNKNLYLEREFKYPIYDDEDNDKYYPKKLLNLSNGSVAIQYSNRIDILS